MSYRTFKHLLGETSLERKCRFIFGGGIFILVTLSFSWYGQKTESLVIGQTNKEARVRAEQTLANIHYKKYLPEELSTFVDELTGERAPLNNRPKFESHVIDPFGDDPDRRPRDEFERQSVDLFLVVADRMRKSLDGRTETARKTDLSAERPILEAARTVGKSRYQYVQAVFLKSNCLVACHQTRDNAQGKTIFNKPDDLAGAIVISLPLEETNRAIYRNRAILISVALVTAILAMFASYVIVRYVIVKPVKHLRDVSDAIASGKLNIRSQIETGDEFEELSRAFNRMLHNLVSMQQELREVNNDLDRKVDELAQANMALFEMNRLKSDFLTTMSHELRTPLNSIIGFSEVLAGSEQLNDRQKRYAANIQSSGKMLLGLINDILDLAKIESGKMEVHVEDFSIRDVCESLAGLSRPLAERKNIDLECRLDEAIPLLRQDAGKIRQILYNLLSNAIKFTPEGGRVTLSARAEGRTAVLEVADTGIGIAPEERESIFEKFRQAGRPSSSDAVLTREHQGTGLGLSIVRELSKLLGGNIELESEPGRGSVFTVRVPLQLNTGRKYEVNLSDERVDLTKARRVEPRPFSPRFPSLSTVEESSNR